MAKKKEHTVTGKRLKEIFRMAMEYAGDFRIQHAGITTDFNVVTTKECVDYQKKNKTLLIHFDGHWKFVHYREGTKWVGSEWKQVIPTELIWQ